MSSLTKVETPLTGLFGKTHEYIGTGILYKEQSLKIATRMC